MEFKILDGRRSFYQWDLNQKLVVEDDRVEQLHFPTEEGNALVCPVYESDGIRMADVPNILLQTPGRIKAFAVADSCTLYARGYDVNPREKPDDYIYTETEVWTAQQAVENALQEAKDSGDFKGDPGPKGDPGVVKFVVVNELPQEDTENAIYFVPVMDGAEDNLFDEYVFVADKWEKIGSAAVAVDLTGYVKNTDIATADAVGVVCCGEGLYMAANTGKINVSPALETHIDAKTTNNRVVTPANIDYAVKIGMTTNTIALTDEEKTAACSWMGAIPANLGTYRIPYTDATGTLQNSFGWTSAASAYTFALRREGGQLSVGEPMLENSATTKAYVDGRITANEDGTLSIKLADGSTYKVAAAKEE